MALVAMALAMPATTLDLAPTALAQALCRFVSSPVGDAASRLMLVKEEDV
jgi:hypothetical protein